jgi:DNA-3-methyladenine glycosylase I
LVSPSNVRPASDGRLRCSWCTAHADYLDYHDSEWGFPVADDRRLFEKLCLEGFQSGLSWLTILRKREAFRRGFADFNFERVARFGERQVTRLLGDAGIVRHRGKIESTIENARRAAGIVDEFGSLAAFVWRFEPKGRPKRVAGSPPQEAVALSKELKKRGFTFVGPTTVYAFMQAMGLVNDHADRCVTRPLVARAQRDFRRP